MTFRKFLGCDHLRLKTAALVVASCLAGLIPDAHAQSTVNTLAGSAGLAGTANGSGSAARFNQPRSIAVDAAGNLFVADQVNHVIRKVTPTGVVTTFCGSAGASGTSDGTCSSARFNYPSGIAIDANGSLFVADQVNHTIRKITAAGTVTTLAGGAGLFGSADGTGTAARFDNPHSVAVGPDGIVWVADTNNHTIRRISTAGAVTTFAGLAGSPGSLNGTGGAARFFTPSALTIDAAGNLYVADFDNHLIRKVTPAAVVTTIAGSGGQPGSTDGTGSAARFSGPLGIARDSAGNLYVGDRGNHIVRKVTIGGTVSTLAGLAGTCGSADGQPAQARFCLCQGVALGAAGELYVADSENHTIRKITNVGPPQRNGTVHVLGGTLAGQALSQSVWEISVNPGTRIQGTINVRTNNLMGSNAVAPFGYTWTWGNREVDFVSHSASIGTGQLDWAVAFDRTAPVNPGTYFILLGFQGEMTMEQVFSCTNWTVTNPSWGDGNDYVDVPADKLTAAHADGFVGAWPIKFPDGNHLFDIPLAPIKVIVACLAPSWFSLSSPAHQSSFPAGTTSVNLQWGTSSGAASYDVYFGTSSTPPLVGNQTQTSKTVAVADGLTYHWKVVAKNSCGSTDSSSGSRTFTVSTPPTADRAVRVAESTGSPGSTVAVPIELVAQGDENALGFSITFDPAILSNAVAALGAGAAGASLNTNVTQTASGRLGVALALPAGQTFAAGTRQLVVVTFTVAAGTSATSTSVGFGDQPIAREVASAAAATLAATWTSGTVTITQGYEADVAPRPNGNGTVSTTDWVQVGRFAAGLDIAAAGSEFQRADCAPRSTFGNGAVSTTDWVQAGRYAAGLDPLTPAGGPTATASAVVPAIPVHTQAAGNVAVRSDARRVALKTLDLGDKVEVTITLDAAGDENALGLSLTFDPQAAGLVGALPGRDAGGALLNLNVTDALAGRIGVAVALPAGRALHGAGAELVVLHFTRAAFDATSPLRVALVEDGPVAAELVSVDAEALPLALDSGVEPDRPVRRRVGSRLSEEGVRP